MKKSKKSYIERGNIPPTVSLAASKPPVSKGAKFTPATKITPADYGRIVFGLNQPNATAPLNAPAGFTTQIPYNSAINGTIITNPSPIPVTSLHQAFVLDPVVRLGFLYLYTTIINMIGDYHIPEYKYKEKADKQHKRIVDNGVLDKAIHHNLTKFLYGFAGGSLKEGVTDGATHWASFLALPPNSLLMAVTPEGELDPDFGLLHYYYNIASGFNQSPYGYSSQGNAPFASYGSPLTPQRNTTFNPIYVSAIPEKNRFLGVFNPMGLAGNFYGESLLPPAWNSLTNKYNFLSKLDQGITYKASPFVTIGCDTGTQVQTPSGFVNQSENINSILPDAAMSGYLVYDGINSLKIDKIDNTMDVEKMLAPLRYCDEQILISLCTPNLIANSGSYANAMANGEAYNIMLTNYCKMIANDIKQQVVITNLKLDLAPDEYPEDWGNFQLLDCSLSTRIQQGQLLQVQKELGILDITQLPDFNYARGKTGLDMVDELTPEMLNNIRMQLGSGAIPQMEANQMAKKPYAQGLKDVQDDHYGT